MRAMVFGCAALLAGCNAIFGVGDLRIDGSGGAGTGGSATGTGGMGAGGACDAGQERSCYDGPEGTEGVGTCHGGMQQCVNGMWSACEGQTLPQTPDCSSEEDLDCNGFACGEVLWTHSFGSSSQEHSSALAAFDDGSLLLGGTLGGSMTIGQVDLTAFGLDGFVAWIDGDGTGQRAETFSSFLGEATVSAADATLDGGVVVCGAFQGQLSLPGGNVMFAQGLYDTYVMRLDAQGEPVWLEQLTGDGSEFCTEIKAMPDGGALLYGRYQDELFIGPESHNSGSWNLHAIRFDGRGQVQWLREFGSFAEERARGLAIVSDGVVLGGSYSNDFVIDGTSLEHSGEFDAFLIKLDLQGQLMWAHAFEGPQTIRTMAVAAAPNDDVVVTGYFEESLSIGGNVFNTPALNTEDVWVARFNAAGMVLWAHHYGDESDERGMAVAVAPSGDAYVAGWFEDSLDLGDTVHQDQGGGRDAFLLRLDTAGNTVFSRSFAISEPPQANDFLHVDVRNVAIDPQGFVLLSALYGGEIGDPTLHSAEGAGDIFLTKLAP